MYAEAVERFELDEIEAIAHPAPLTLYFERMKALTGEIVEDSLYLERLLQKPPEPPHKTRQRVRDTLMLVSGGLAVLALGLFSVWLSWSRRVRLAS